MDIEFQPKEGMVTHDSYLHGCGTLDNIGCTGKIVYVGSNYFVLEDLINNIAFVIDESSYWVIQEGDFY